MIFFFFFFFFFFNTLILCMRVILESLMAQSPSSKETMLLCLDIACTSGASGSHASNLLSIATAAAKRTSESLSPSPPPRPSSPDHAAPPKGIDIQRESERARERPLLALCQWFNSLHDSAKHSSLRLLITSPDTIARTPAGAQQCIDIQRVMGEARAILQSLTTPAYGRRVDNTNLITQVLSSITGGNIELATPPRGKHGSKHNNSTNKLDSTNEYRLGSELEVPIDFESGYLARFLHQILRIGDTLKLDKLDCRSILAEGPHHMLLRLIFDDTQDGLAYDKAEALAGLLDVDIVRVILNSLDRVHKHSSKQQTTAAGSDSSTSDVVNTALNTAVVEYIGKKCNILSRLACVLKQPVTRFNAALYDYVAALSFPTVCNH
jgi:hypothetical protein